MKSMREVHKLVSYNVLSPHLCPPEYFSSCKVRRSCVHACGTQILGLGWLGRGALCMACTGCRTAAPRSTMQSSMHALDRAAWGYLGAAICVRRGTCLQVHAHSPSLASLAVLSADSSLPGAALLPFALASIFAAQLPPGQDQGEAAAACAGPCDCVPAGGGPCMGGGNAKARKFVDTET